MQGGFLKLKQLKSISLKENRLLWINMVILMYAFLKLLSGICLYVWIVVKMYEQLVFVRSSNNKEAVSGIGDTEK